MGSEFQEFISSPLMVEGLARRSMLLHAISIGLENLRFFFSDSQTLVRAINGKLLDKEIFGIIADIRRLSESFASISFSFVPRTENTEADCLAKSVLLLRNLSL